MRRSARDSTGDLFAASGGRGVTALPSGERGLPPDAYSDGRARTPSAPLRLIASPLVDETAAWLEGRLPSLGTLLASDRAVEYVAILRAFADFRRRHEPEPLHEDVMVAVCGETLTAEDESTFKSDLRQLKDWGIVTERIEKERLRGYRDNRRTKFRYRMCDEAAQLVDWLSDRRSHQLEDEGDVTGNLLDLQCSLLHELRRKLKCVGGGRGYPPNEVSSAGGAMRGATALPQGSDVPPIEGHGSDSDLAGDVMFRVEQMRRTVEATARTLQTLNLRLLSFGADSFSIDEAKPIVEELGLFLDRFGRRFGALRSDIADDIAELRRDCHAKRWQACADALRAESERFRHIASVRIPDAAALLADAAAFYAPDGALVDLMHRIVDSARKVWGKLNSRLRELERRNHRLEDLALRLDDLAGLDENDVPYGWLRGLLRTAAMRGDAQVRPGGEKSVAPRPKAAAKSVSRKDVTWITPRKVGDRANVASIAQVRFERLKAWMVERGIYPKDAPTRISDLTVREFADFPNVMQLIAALRLGEGEKARRYLKVAGTPNGASARLGSEDVNLGFEDLDLRPSAAIMI